MLRQLRFTMRPDPAQFSGFTLVEMAIVLIIVTVLMGGLMVGLSSQYDGRAQAQTEQTLADIREALLGFAVTKGRLPCPAEPALPNQGQGTEFFVAGSGATSVTGGPCNNPFNGMIPGTDLGISPTDSRGYVLDGWGQRIRYSITNANSANFTFATSGQIRQAINSSGNPNFDNLHPNLIVCSQLSGTNCASNSTLVTNAVVVIYSFGKNGCIGCGGGISTDESANATRTSNTPFVSHAPTDPNGSNAFDDIVTWISPYTLYSRMISAGQLP